MSGHTKGPWTFYDECGAAPEGDCGDGFGFHDLCQAAYDSDHKLIGPSVLSVCKTLQNVEGLCEKCGESSCSGWLKIRREDALLGMAAPDLLETVEAVVASGGIHGEVLEKARAALAKAKGLPS